MVLGIVTGYIIHESAAPETISAFSKNIKLLGTIFIRLVKTIIAPLVFSTLVVGIAKLGDLKTVGRVGGKAMLWFVSASLVSLLVGMILVNYFQPGSYINLSQADNAGLQDLMGKTSEFSLQKFIEHVVPASIFEAMATNEILQIVVFSIFFGVAAANLGPYSKPVINALDIVAHIILKIVGYVMNFAPFGVFGTLAAVVADKGLGILVLLYLLWVFCFRNSCFMGTVMNCWFFNSWEKNVSFIKNNC